MDLGHDLLDNQILDRAGTRLGKVDSVVLTVPATGPPRVVALEVGPIVVAERVHPRWGRWLAGVVRRRRWPFGRTRIPWARVTRVGRDVHVALDAHRTRAHAFEDWLRTRIVGRIPGAR